MGAGAYGATFFMLTGFHGFHVTLGAIMLTVILGRTPQGPLHARAPLRLRGRGLVLALRRCGVAAAVRAGLLAVTGNQTDAKARSAAAMNSATREADAQRQRAHGRVRRRPGPGRRRTSRRTGCRRWPATSRRRRLSWRDSRMTTSRSSMRARRRPPASWRPHCVWGGLLAALVAALSSRSASGSGASSRSRRRLQAELDERGRAALMAMPRRPGGRRQPALPPRRACAANSTPNARSSSTTAFIANRPATTW